MGSHGEQCTKGAIAGSSTAPTRISKVTDIVEIANRGVMMTPALSVDGDIVLVGKVATAAVLKSLLGGEK